MDRRARARGKLQLIGACAAFTLCAAETRCFAADPREDRVEGWFTPPPFQRVVDVEIAFLTGYPDTIGACVEVNPFFFVSADGCLSVWKESVSVHVASRFLNWVSFKRRASNREFFGEAFSFGPAFGYRTLQWSNTVSSTADDASTDVTDLNFVSTLDVQGSFEWVHWVSPYFGVALQIDAGTSYITSGDHKGFIPNARLTLGPTF